MIVFETVDNLKKTFSDSGFKIRKVGTNEIYSEAWDLVDRDYEYEETDELIEVVED